MVNTEKILELSKISTTFFNGFLEKKQINLSNKVLNAALKSAIIEKILSSEDCEELVNDTQKIETFNNAQLRVYIEYNHLSIPVDRFLTLLWSVIFNNYKELNLNLNELNKLSSEEIEIENITDSLNKLTVFIDEETDFDGVTHDMFKTSILEKSSFYELVELFNLLKLELPKELVKQDFYEILLAYYTKHKQVSTVNYNDICKFPVFLPNSDDEEEISLGDIRTNEQEEELLNVLKELEDLEDEDVEEVIENDFEDEEGYNLENVVDENLVDSVLNDNDEEVVENKNIKENNKNKENKKSSIFGDYVIALLLWLIIMTIFMYIRYFA